MQAEYLVWWEAARREAKSGPRWYRRPITNRAAQAAVTILASMALTTVAFAAWYFGQAVQIAASTRALGTVVVSNPVAAKINAGSQTCSIIGTPPAELTLSISQGILGDGCKFTWQAQNTSSQNVFYVQPISGGDPTASGALDVLQPTCGDALPVSTSGNLTEIDLTIGAASSPSSSYPVAGLEVQYALTAPTTCP